MWQFSAVETGCIDNRSIGGDPHSSITPISIDDQFATDRSPLPLTTDLNPIDGGADSAIWLYLLLSIVVAILGYWAGTKLRSKFTKKNIALAIVIVYLVMAMAIYNLENHRQHQLKRFFKPKLQERFSQLKPYRARLFGLLLGMLAIGYGGFCAYLYFNQGQILYNPRRDLFRLPSDPKLKLNYQELLIPVTDRDNLHGWWLSAPTADEPPVLAQEPSKILSSPKTLLFFYGRAGNKSSVLFRLQGLHQLGFSILVVDYRGYGASGGDFPNELQMYRDAELAWQYLTQTRNITPQDIVIYGESMGGAVAIDLASKHPDAHALIAQSTFTTLADAARQNSLLQLFPIDLLLTNRYRSLDKVGALKMPVLFLHGERDPIVDVSMSQRLYRAAPQPKEIYIVPAAGHFAIYNPDSSYLQAIRRFLWRSTKLQRNNGN